MFKHGPLYAKRKEIIQELKSLGIRTGDILYRYSNAKGPFGLPFSKLVAYFTKSKYSHASVALVEEKEIYILEVNDRGTIKYRLIDWLDTCYNGHLAVYRLKDLTRYQEDKLRYVIEKFLERDPDYDFTFSHKEKFYCTESVVHIYKAALNIQITNGNKIKEVVPWWFYIPLKTGSKIFSFFGTSLPFEERLFFVGNEKMGMLSSTKTYRIFEV